LSRFVETANAPIFGVNIHGCVTEWNRKAAELSGFSKDEAMGNS
jgi:PAS domain S-box-containing protein